MKLTIIGGGGVRSLFLAKTVALQAQNLRISELVLMDNDADKLATYGNLARSVATFLEPGLNIRLTDDPIDALRDADAVITTIRVGGDDARIADEQVAESLGLLPQETTGACGFSFAMRSIPALMRYCELTRRYAKPGTKVFNFTNPAGLVTQAMRDSGYDFALGICDAPTSLFSQIAKMRGFNVADLDVKCFGLNHLSWFSELTVNGKDITEDLIADPRLYRDTDMKFFEPALVADYGCLFNEYLYYYYYREQAVENIRRSGTTRGRAIQAVNRDMTAAFQSRPNAGLEEKLAIFEHWYGMRENSYMAAETGKKRNQTYRFDLTGDDHGGYAGVALKYISILQTGNPGRMILSVPNQGALPFLAKNDVAELSCTITGDGAIVPDQLEEPLHPVATELIRRMKLYERNASTAILNRDRKLAVEALQNHPLIASYSLATKLTDAFFEINRPWITDRD